MFYPVLFIGMLVLTANASGVGAGESLLSMSSPAIGTVIMTAAVLAVRTQLPAD